MFLSICTNSNLLSVISVVKFLLDLICTIIPIILIIMVTFDIAKIVISPDEKTMSGVSSALARRMIAAVAIFFVPIFVNIITTRAEKTNYNNTSCWKNANTVSIERFSALEKEAKKTEELKLKTAKEEAKAIRETLAKERENERLKAEAKAKDEASRTSATTPVATPATNTSNYDLLASRNKIKYYYQTDYLGEPYGNIKHKTMVSSGCGPTSVAVVATAFLGEAGNDPITVKNWICKQGGCSNNGTYWQQMKDYLTNRGLKVEAIWNKTANVNTSFRNALADNALIIILVRDNGHCSNEFTSGGHYFVLTGLTSDGKVEIAEVNSRSRTARKWNMSELTRCMNSAAIVRGRS